MPSYCNCSVCGKVDLWSQNDQQHKDMIDLLKKEETTDPIVKKNILPLSLKPRF